MSLDSLPAQLLLVAVQPLFEGTEKIQWVKYPSVFEINQHIGPDVVQQQCITFDLLRPLVLPVDLSKASVERRTKTHKAGMYVFERMAVVQPEVWRLMEQVHKNCMQEVHTLAKADMKTLKDLMSHRQIALRHKIFAEMVTGEVPVRKQLQYLKSIIRRQEYILKKWTAKKHGEGKTESIRKEQ